MISKIVLVFLAALQLLESTDALFNGPPLNEELPFLSMNVTLNPLRSVQTLVESVQGEVNETIDKVIKPHEPQSDVHFITREVAKIIENAAEPLQKITDAARNGINNVRQKLEAAGAHIEKTAEDTVSAAIKPIQNALRV